MQFVFDENKTTQAAAYVLARHRDKKMNYTVAIKVLYLADRQALIETGRPITGDWMASLPNGPVLSITLNLIREQRRDDEGPWLSHITTRGYDIELVKQPEDMDELSEYERRVLADADDKIGWMEFGQAIDWTHKNLPEWRNPGGSSHPIEPEDLLRIARKSPEEIQHLTEIANDLWLFRSRRGRPN